MIVVIMYGGAHYFVDAAETPREFVSSQGSSTYFEDTKGNVHAARFIESVLSLKEFEKRRETQKVTHVELPTDYPTLENLRKVGKTGLDSIIEHGQRCVDKGPFG